MAIEQCGDHGEFTLPYGVHEVEVILGYTPQRVYLSFEDEDHQCCGGGDNNSCGNATLLDDGFLVCTVVNTNVSVVRWVAY